MISLKTYIKKSELEKRKELDKVSYIAYYISKTGNNEFQVNEINQILNDNGFYISNLSRIKRQIKESKMYRCTKKDFYSLTNYGIKSLKHLDEILDIDDIEECENELLETSLFCGHAYYLDKLILQANKCYEEKCYDACATMLRRILEILLIKSYEHFGIEQAIKDSNGNYFLLEGICNEAINNTTLNLSRKKNKLNEMRDLGNYAAHRITYNTTKRDIDNLKTDLRVLLEELLYKSGLKH